jgi:hypothetical protein
MDPVLDFPASGSALWAISDATGIRPEWLLPVLQSESGLNPAIQNLSGYPYYGLNQISGSYLTARGIDASDYLTWPGSRQLSTIVQPYMASQVAAFGPLRSGTRVYQANFLPATLKTAKSLSSVLARQTHSCTGTGLTNDIYCANPGLDWQHNGTITVGDLAHFISAAAATSNVQSAIAQTYALRPAQKPMDPVYGLDFGGGATLPTSEKVLIVAALLTTLGALVALAWDRKLLR